MTEVDYRETGDRPRWTFDTMPNKRQRATLAIWFAIAEVHLHKTYGWFGLEDMFILASFHPIKTTPNPMRPSSSRWHSVIECFALTIKSKQN
jgi:hypothetical protein